MRHCSPEMQQSVAGGNARKCLFHGCLNVAGVSRLIPVSPLGGQGLRARAPFCRSNGDAGCGYPQGLGRAQPLVLTRARLQGRIQPLRGLPRLATAIDCASGESCFTLVSAR